MKTSFLRLSGPAVVLIAFLASCNKIPSESALGTLSWNFSSGILTRSVTDLPDTDAFILTVRNSANTVLYKGPYGNSPESMLVDPGSYGISVVSREFDAPEFDAPQFGDEQVVVVKAGAGTRVVLGCTQLNCGMRLLVDPGFPSSFPGGRLSVDSDDGTLDYGTGETRTGFFKPGNLSVMLHDGGTTTRLLTRNLQAREMLTLGLACPESPETSEGRQEISIEVDTLRLWSEEEMTIGGEGADAGKDTSRAYGVSQARDHAGEKAVWVCGYIVGGDLSSSKNGIRFEPPFESMTCIALAPRSSVTEKASCLSVQLSKGAIRDALNLVGNPGLLGRKVYLKGDIEASYYGIPGLKNLTEYSFD